MFIQKLYLYICIYIYITYYIYILIYNRLQVDGIGASPKISITFCN